MVNVKPLLTKLGNMQGSRASVTLGRKQLEEIIERSNVDKKVAEELRQLLSFAKKPQLDVAYKVSEQGFSVATMAFKDGKNVLGKGAASVTGAGTEAPLFKYRFNVGENSNILKTSGWFDLGQNYDLAKTNMNMSFNNGVMTSVSKVGNTAASRNVMNFEELMNTLARLSKQLSPENAAEIDQLNYANMMNKANGYMNEGMDYLRKLLTGQLDESAARVAKVADEVGELASKVAQVDKVVDDVAKRAPELAPKVTDDIAKCAVDVAECAGKEKPFNPFVYQDLEKIKSIKEILNSIEKI